VNTLLWIIQCLLALVFTLVGLMMLTTPKERIIQRAPWAEKPFDRAAEAARIYPSDRFAAGSSDSRGRCLSDSFGGTGVK
jgi:hypothetical protein